MTHPSLQTLNPHEQSLTYSSRVCHAEFFYCVGNIGLNTIKGPFLQQPLENLIPSSWLSPTNGHATGSLHTSKPDEIVQVKVVCTVTVPPIPSFINPLNQQMGSRIRTGVHTHAVGSMGMGHARHTRDCVATESPWDKIARSVVTRHCEECKGSKTEGLVYFSSFSFSSSFYLFPMPSRGHYAIGSSFQAFLPLDINFPLFIILILHDIAPFLCHAPILPLVDLEVM